MRKHHEERFVGAIEKRNQRKRETGRHRMGEIRKGRRAGDGHEGRNEPSGRRTRRKREKERKVSKRSETGERVGGRRDELP